MTSQRIQFQDGEDTCSFDFYAKYCETIAKVYGAKYCPTREKWDAMCAQPRRVRKLTDDEFDDNQESLVDGGGEIYS
jgi:hypothetical protein